MRAVIPFVTTVVVVCLLAPLLGTGLFGILTGTPQLVVSRDLAGVPMLFYAALVSLSFALPAAVVAAVAATIFSYAVGQRQPFWVWLATFSAFGLFLGVACASPLILASAGSSTIGLARAWVILGALCGVGVMSLVSSLWYFFFRVIRKTSV
jgi:hypothetical protein